MDTFSDDLSSFDYESSVETPPAPLAWLGVLLAACGIACAAFSTDLGWIGYFFAFLGIACGIGYRTVVRTKQKSGLVLPNIRIDRISLAGVGIGFIGIIWNAINAAQRVVS